MDRKLIFEALSGVATVRQLSNREGLITGRTLILAKKPQMGSTSNSRAGFQYWEVMCYVPATSMLALDILVKEVETVLKDIGTELTLSNTPEFYDDQLKAYMVSVEFRTIITI